jgi:hypothetical protein
VFSGLKQAEIREISNPPVGPVSYTHEVIQGNRELGLLSDDAELAEAEEAVAGINKGVKRRVAAIRAVAAFSLLAGGTAVGLGIINKSGPSAAEGSEAKTPAPTALQSDMPQLPTKSATPSSSPTPETKYKLSPVRLTLAPKPKPHHHTHQHHGIIKHVASTSEAPTSPSTSPPTPYVPPQNTYSPPPPPKPHLIIHHLNEKH